MNISQFERRMQWTFTLNSLCWLVTCRLSWQLTLMLWELLPSGLMAYLVHVTLTCCLQLSEWPEQEKPSSWSG